VHYLSTGYNQGRNPYCTANLTNIQAKRYLSRYPELNQKVGVSSRSAFQYARDFFNSVGHKEHHDIAITDSLEKPWKCADGGSTCQCKGRVYLGPLFAEDDKKEIKHFDDLMHWHTESVYTKDGETIGCDINSFAQTDAWSGAPKQCFCEPSFAYTPNHCANEGGDCQCQGGTVFYARRYKTDTQKVDDLSSAMLQSFAVVEANNSETIKCMAQTFEGAEPLPGLDKDCYCDWKNQLMQPTEVLAVKDLWRGVMAEKTSRNVRIDAQRAAEDAQRKAAEALKTQENNLNLWEASETKAATDLEDAFQKSKQEANNMAQAETSATLSTMQTILSEAKQSEEDAMVDDQRARAQLLAAESTLGKNAQSLTADEVDAAELQKAEAIKHQITASLKLQSAQHKRQMAQM
jgi:hypothetical protein